MFRPSVKTAMLALAGIAAARRRNGRRRFMRVSAETSDEWAGFRSRAGMERVIKLLQPSPRDVSVNLRRRDVRMAEHQLDAAEIGAVLQEMGGKRVPEHVRRDVRADSGV